MRKMDMLEVEGRKYDLFHKAVTIIPRVTGILSGVQPHEIRDNESMQGAKRLFNGQHQLSVGKAQERPSEKPKTKHQSKDPAPGERVAVPAPGFFCSD
jgi:hypothetical protein